MMALDRDALICDLAEEYQIYDMRSLPVQLIATLSVGLREDSRIKKRISGRKYSRQELLLARIADKLSALIWLWGGYGDAEETPSIIDAMIGGVPEEPEGKFKVYRTAEDFMNAWNE